MLMASSVAVSCDESAAAETECIADALEPKKKNDQRNTPTAHRVSDAPFPEKDQARADILYLAHANALPVGQPPIRRRRPPLLLCCPPHRQSPHRLPYIPPFALGHDGHLLPIHAALVFPHRRTDGTVRFHGVADGKRAKEGGGVEVSGEDVGVAAGCVNDIVVCGGECEGRDEAKGVLAYM